MITHVWFAIIWLSGYATTVIIEIQREDFRKWLDDYEGFYGVNGWWMLYIANLLWWPIFMGEQVYQLAKEIRSEFYYRLMKWRVDRIFRKHGTTLEEEVERIEQEKKEKETLNK